MLNIFEEVFNRKPSVKEKIILHRLVNLYGEDVTLEAVKVGCVVTEGSPINYISKVASNIHKEEIREKESSYDNLKDKTRRRLEELEKYGHSS